MALSLCLLFAVLARAANGVDPDDPQVASCTMPEVEMQRVPIHVAFSVGEDNALSMDVITHTGETIQCIGLADDMDDVTEVRAADGVSFETIRGSGGYLLQSSQSDIECRVHLRNSSDAPYTAADVPNPPGFLSAYIVHPSGRSFDIEWDAVTNTYVSLVPKEEGRATEIVAEMHEDDNEKKSMVDEL
eukprot:GEMP01088114.1.p2 GENE.GEMP01088114.1~~GEMP01088114.1.p2  ORF type:complete len:188 (+),score=54.99 GEMP01088114.1:180-743(+)